MGQMLTISRFILDAKNIKKHKKHHIGYFRYGFSSMSCMTSLLKLHLSCAMLCVPRTMLFSATLNASVEDLAALALVRS
jgi:hypothetical protein